ncbi:DUF2530 domain-containing protein [Kitasatospora mediocidica]|uniref:DUF2530 domain-containing protein n=1 Tax=Kitasatospora mediocidica TaxID=58352 RepID=UPI000565D361|nr:DUF2530 domain-containing protein [Kitasatospora mediocidica]
MPKIALRPSPPPLETNDVAIVGAGTALWFLGFVVLLPFHSTLQAQGHGHGNWQWICLSGGLLGLIGLWYCRARRAAILRDRAATAAGATEEP